MEKETSFADIPPTPAKWADNEEIRIFLEYLRIPTVHPDVDYSKFISYISKFYPFQRQMFIEFQSQLLHSWKSKQPV